jgi:UDP-2,3-diacylglucosamine pyrophosphatase LpxH
MAHTKLKFETIWLSDIHLGSRECKADFLYQFLARAECRTLYLVGDVVDFWSMKNQWFWPAEHMHLLRKLLERADNGTRVVYVPGNHDDLMREIAARAFGKLSIERRAEHTTLRGKRLLITHGDEFEYGIRCSLFARFLGSVSYNGLLRLNRLYNRLRAWRGKPYWSLSTYIKNRVGNARRAIDAFEQAAAHAARDEGFDGVICGHIHQPRIREIDGLLYCNDGDWVDNCTTLVEHLDGTLELLHWSDLQRQDAVAQAANDPAKVDPALMQPAYRRRALDATQPAAGHV